MNELELEGNTCNWRQAHENAYQQATIGFGFMFDWLTPRASNHEIWGA